MLTTPIGQQELRDLVLTTAAVNLFKGLLLEQVNRIYSGFWALSVASLRAYSPGVSIYWRERLFIAGLLL